MTQYVVRMMGGCNQACKHCFVTSEWKAKNYISLEQFKEALKSKSPSNVNFFGGEPTIQPHLLDMIKYAKSKEMYTVLSTNARTFSSEHYTKKVKETGLDSINVSLYGHLPIIHDYITNTPSSFEQTVFGIKNILKFKIDLLVNVVIMQPNYQYLPDIAQFLVDLNVKRVRFSSLLLQDEALQHLDVLVVRYSKVRPFLNKALKILSLNNVSFSIEKTPVCIAPSYASHFIKESDPEERKRPKNMLKGVQCTNCEFNNDCVGLSKKYSELFGFSELIAYRAQPISVKH